MDPQTNRPCSPTRWRCRTLGTRQFSFNACQDLQGCAGVAAIRDQGRGCEPPVRSNAQHCTIAAARALPYANRDPRAPRANVLSRCKDAKAPPEASAGRVLPSAHAVTKTLAASLGDQDGVLDLHQAAPGMVHRGLDR